MFTIANKKRFALFVAGIIVIIAGIGFVAYKAVKNYQQTPAIERLTLADAAKNGPKQTVQLLVQISSNGGGGLERGDVVLTAPADKQFSIAEQEGFLIIKVNLTQDEQNLLALSLKQQSGIFASQQDKMNTKEIKLRKFAVDLAKVGINPSETTGKVIADKVFEDDILLQKQIPQ